MGRKQKQIKMVFQTPIVPRITRAVLYCSRGGGGKLNKNANLRGKHLHKFDVATQP
jgi:hypothetical protein